MYVRRHILFRKKYFKENHGKNLDHFLFWSDNGKYCCAAFITQNAESAQRENVVIAVKIRSGNLPITPWEEDVSSCFLHGLAANNQIHVVNEIKGDWGRLDFGCGGVSIANAMMMAPLRNIREISRFCWDVR